MAISLSVGYSQAVRLLLQHGASSAVLDSLGQHLYQCQQFQGVQALLDQHRRRHTEAIMAAIRQRKGLSQLQAIFIVSDVFPMLLVFAVLYLLVQP